MELGLSLGLARRDEEEEEEEEVQLSLQPFAPASRNLGFPWINDSSKLPIFFFPIFLLILMNYSVFWSKKSIFYALVICEEKTFRSFVI